MACPTKLTPQVAEDICAALRTGATWAQAAAAAAGGSRRASCTLGPSAVRRRGPGGFWSALRAREVGIAVVAKVVYEVVTDGEVEHGRLAGIGGPERSARNRQHGNGGNDGAAHASRTARGNGPLPNPVHRRPLPGDPRTGRPGARRRGGKYGLLGKTRAGRCSWPGKTRPRGRPVPVYPTCGGRSSQSRKRKSPPPLPAGGARPTVAASR